MQKSFPPARLLHVKAKVLGAFQAPYFSSLSACAVMRVMSSAALIWPMAPRRHWLSPNAVTSGLERVVPGAYRSTGTGCQLWDFRA